MTDIIDLWRDLSTDARFTDAAELTRTRVTFERRIRRRNLGEYAAGAIVLPAFAGGAWLSAQMGDLVTTLGWVLAIVGISVVLTSLYYRAGNLPDRPETDCRTHLRAQYEHQRKALAAVPQWYLAPLVPGIVLVMIGTILPVVQREGWAAALAGGGLACGAIVGLFAAVAWLNRRAARWLEQQIATLDSLA